MAMQRSIHYLDFDVIYPVLRADPIFWTMLAGDVEISC